MDRISIASSEKGTRGENGGRRVAPALAQTSSPPYSGSGPRAAATGRGGQGRGWWRVGGRFREDSRGEILLTFSPPSLALSICQAQRAASLSRSPSEREDKSAESGPPSLRRATTSRYSGAGNKRQILSPKHSRGYNEARTKQTGESQPDKQFHFQSSAERPIAALSPAAAAACRCWTPTAQTEISSWSWVGKEGGGRWLLGIGLKSGCGGGVHHRH